MFDVFRPLGTAPRRSLDKALLAARAVGATVFAFGFFALLLLAPPRRSYGLDVPTVDITEYPRWLGGTWFDFALELRALAALAAALVAAAFAAWQAWKRTPLSEVVERPHHDDPALHYGEYGARALQAELDGSYGSRSPRGLWLAPGVQLPFEAENQFVLVVGDKGSGKSNIVRALATQMVRRGDKVLLHCVKGDVSEAFRRSEAVLIAAHHAHGWAWDAARDIVGLAGFTELAAATVPMSDQPFWALTARIVFVDIGEALAMERGTFWTFDELTRRIVDDPAVIEARIRRLDLSASPIIREGPDGLNNTVLGVMVTLWSAALNALRPLAIAWASVPPERRFSVRAWLSRDWNGPRVVIVQTSPDYEEVSRLVSGTLLTRVVNTLSDPAIPIDQERRVALALDEFHNLHIDRIDRVLALGREKGLVVVAALQSLGQLRSLYGPVVGGIVQDLFRYRIFSTLTAGESAETAMALIGRREVTWRAANDAPEPGDKRRWIRKNGERPIVSAATLQGELGVKVVREARKGRPAVKEIRGVVTGVRDVHHLTWPILIWRKRRAGYVPAAWLTAPRPLAAVNGTKATPFASGSPGSDRP